MLILPKNSSCQPYLPLPRWLVFKQINIDLSMKVSTTKIFSIHSLYFVIVLWFSNDLFGLGFADGGKMQHVTHNGGDPKYGIEKLPSNTSPWFIYQLPSKEFYVRKYFIFLMNNLTIIYFEIIMLPSWSSSSSMY